MSLVDCSKVCVKDAGFQRGLGAFANEDISSGDIVEVGVVRRVETEGNKNPYLFTWSEDRTVWAFASGCATFYNTSKDPNTKMDRDFVNDVYTVRAIKDIQKDEELTHTYRSLSWRTCFQELNKSI